MSEDEKKRQLIDELWPTPAPPPDLAARVLAAMDGHPRPASAPVLAPARPPSRRRPLVAALALGAAAAAGMLWWVTAGDGAAIEEDGGQIASAPLTVPIGGRASAAMEPGARVDWSVRKERVRVHQRRGAVVYKVQRGNAFQVTTADGEVEVTGTRFRVSLEGGQPATTVVTVLEGSVKVRGGSDELALSIGQSARLRRGMSPEAVTLSPPAPAPVVVPEPAEPAVPAARERSREQPSALLLPASTRVRVYGNSLRKVSLAVASRRGANVEVARDPQFRRPVFAGPVQSAFVTVPAPSRGDLYWRVAGTGELAGHARFLPGPRASDKERPHNVVSEGRQSTTIYFQGEPPALTLAFAATPGAHRYRARLHREGAPDRPIVERLVDEPRCPVGPGALTEGRYLWRVEALDKTGRALDERPANKLELLYDNNRSTLEISRPKPDQSASGRWLPVAGVAPLGARLTVNGTAAPLDDKGRFSLKVAASGVLVFRLLAADGSESYWVRELRR